MKRRDFIKTAGLGAAAGAGLVTAAQARAQQTSGLPNLQWRLAASWPKSLDTLFGGAEMVARRVGEITDGKFQIRVFAAGEIVPALQVLDAVQADVPPRSSWDTPPPITTLGRIRRSPWVPQCASV